MLSNQALNDVSYLANKHEKNSLFYFRFFRKKLSMQYVKCKLNVSGFPWKIVMQCNTPLDEMQALVYLKVFIPCFSLHIISVFRICVYVTHYTIF